MKIKQIVGNISEAVKVTNVNPSTGEVTYKDDVTNVTTTVPKGAAIPNAPGQIQINTSQLQTGQPGQTAQLGIKVGDTVQLAGPNVAGSTAPVVPTGPQGTMGANPEESQTEDQDLEELGATKSKKALMKYANKAYKDTFNKSMTSPNTYDKDPDISKRLKGIERAEKRLSAMDKPTFKDTVELDEIKKLSGL